MVTGNRSLTEEQKQIVTMIRSFIQRDVLPVVSKLDHEDIYPTAIVERMKGLGLFGATIPQQYGGMGLDCTTYAMLIEELAKGWMSLTSVINTHLIMAYVLRTFGTEEQKERYLRLLAEGTKRGGLALTEPNAGTDVQALEVSAVRDGGDYVINGTKMFITNGETGNTFALLAKTDKSVRPMHKGISCFIAEKGPGFIVGRKLKKLGLHGVDTVELIFQDYRCPAANLVGGEEGKGFGQIMAGLELGRINVAARAVGEATAAFEAAIRYAQQRKTMGKPIAEHQVIQLKLADMATQIEAARLLTYSAAQKKDRGERCDLEAGMAKLFASEACFFVATEALRIHGGVGYIQDMPVERYFRDAPLMMIGEGTNEVQKLVIARNLIRAWQD